MNVDGLKGTICLIKTIFITAPTQQETITNSIIRFVIRFQLDNDIYLQAAEDNLIS